MMSSKFASLSIKIGAFAVLFCAMVLFSGCSKDILNSDSDLNQPKLLSRAPMFTSNGAFSPGTLTTSAKISAIQGGRLELYDVVLDIPPGALKNDTTYSINIPDPTVFYNEFGTDGLVFLKPVTVTMSYREADLSGVDESTIRIGYLNHNTGQYENVICTVNFEDKTVTGQLNHFSAYGLISDEE